MQWWFEKIGVPVITCVLGIMGGYYANDSLNRKQHARLIEEARNAKEQTKQEERRAFYEQLQVHLNGSWAAFNNQVEVRERLMRLLSQRLGSVPHLQYEPLFRKEYTQFSDEEKFLCDIMRGITVESLYKHNSAMLSLLQRNPEYRAELKSFDALQDHFGLWLSKYKGLEKREDWCLVYVGVADKKPFPPQIRNEVTAILDQIAQASGKPSNESR